LLLLLLLADAALGDDKPTEELLLLCLCSLAVAHTTSSSGMDSILLQLVGPQLNAASEELTAALHGSWPQQQQRQQHQSVQSTAVSCFKALATLVAGLPTGVTKQTIGVPMHSRHPRHQQQLLQQQQQQQHAAGRTGSIRQHHLTAAAGSAAAAGRAGEDDASMGSVASDVSGSAAHALHLASAGLSPAAAAVLTGSTPLQCQGPGKCGHAYCQQQQDQAAAAAAAAQQRQHQACFVVSQLLRRASQPVLLALRAAAAAAEQEQLQTLAQQLLSATCSFLLSALPAAVQYQQQLLHCHSGPAHAGSSSSSCSSSWLANTSAAAAAAAASAAIQQHSSSSSSSSGSSQVIQPGLLLVQLCQLLEQLPVQLLQQPCCLQLLCSSVAAAAASCALPRHEGSSAADAQQQLQQDVQQQQQLLGMLQGLVSQSLAAACASILGQSGNADPDHTAAALGLATVCLQQCPAVLAAADLDSLLAMTLLATKTYHLKQCTAVLEWIQVLVQAAYSTIQQQPQGLANHSAAAAAAASSGYTALVALRQRLEAGGTGSQLLLSLMLAAAGAMPPDVVLPVSYCLHSTWLSAGRQFEGWLQAAVLQLAPDSAPWQRQRHGAKVRLQRACFTESWIACTRACFGVWYAGTWSVGCRLRCCSWRLTQRPAAAAARREGESETRFYTMWMGFG
jgi:hypothetical protein